MGASGSKVTMEAEGTRIKGGSRGGRGEGTALTPPKAPENSTQLHIFDITRKQSNFYLEKFGLYYLLNRKEGKSNDFRYCVVEMSSSSPRAELDIWMPNTEQINLKYSPLPLSKIYSCAPLAQTFEQTEKPDLPHG